MGLYLISACTNPLTTYVVDFPADVFPTAPTPGDVYFLDFTGSTTSDCYTVGDSDPGPAVDSISAYTYYVDCATCLTGPTPTPTVTQTQTPESTPSESPRPTPSSTPDPTPDSTPTPTPSYTPTSTPASTPAATPTPTPTPPGYWIITDCFGGNNIVEIEGVSPTLGKMYLFTFSGRTPYACYFVTGTSYGPIFDTAVYLDGPYDDCEECGGDYTGTSVNRQYEYTSECCDPVSGATGSSAVVPHPVYANQTGVAIQLNCVELGGLNGVNN